MSEDSPSTPPMSLVQDDMKKDAITDDEKANLRESIVCDLYDCKPSEKGDSLSFVNKEDVEFKRVFKKTFSWLSGQKTSLKINETRIKILGGHTDASGAQKLTIQLPRVGTDLAPKVNVSFFDSGTVYVSPAAKSGLKDVIDASHCLKYLFDGFHDNTITAECLESFISAGKYQCQMKGCNFVSHSEHGVKSHETKMHKLNKPKAGARLQINMKRREDRLQMSMKRRSSPMKVPEQITKSVKFNEMTSASDETAALLKEGHSADDSQTASLEEYSMELGSQPVEPLLPPESEIIRVAADGACLVRAVSVTLFGDESNFSILARALNKAIYQNWSHYKQFYDFPRQVIVGANQMIMNTESDFLNLLQTSESIFMWRNHEDIQAISDMLSVKIKVIKENPLTETQVEPCPDINDGPVEKEVVIINSSDHYFAVKCSIDPAQCEKIVMKMITYISSDSEEEERMSKLENLMSTVMNRIEMLEKDNKELSIKVVRVEDDNRQLRKENKLLETNINDLKRQHRGLRDTHDNLRLMLDEIKKNSTEKEDDSIDMIEMVEMKKNGYSRTSPQSEAEKKRSEKNKYHCSDCKMVFHSQRNFNLHQTGALGCGNCETKTKSLTELSEHREKEKVKFGNGQNIVTNSTMDTSEPLSLDVVKLKDRKREFNCYVCHFEGHNVQTLRKHRMITGHKETSDCREVCHTCNTIFQDYKELMLHRKETHSQIIPECRYFKDNCCQFGSSCWYRHSTDQSSEKVSQNSGKNNVQNNLQNNQGFQFQNNQGFQLSKAIPPDQLSKLTSVLVEITNLIKSQQ